MPPKKKKPTQSTPAVGGGASLGGPPTGASLGAPPAGASLGAPPAGASLGGAALGGPPSAGASLGTPPAATGSLGGPPPATGSLGGPPAGGPPAAAGSLGGPPAASLGGPPAGGSLGGPPASLGGPPASSLGGASLGGAPASSAASKNKKKKAKAAAAPVAVGGSLGGPPAAAGASLGGAPAAGASLGGTPAAALGGASLGGAPGSPLTSSGEGAGEPSTGEAAATSAAAKKKQKKKKAAAEKPAEKKPAAGGAKSKLAALIKKQQEEEERLRLEEERLAREEEERLAREEEERKKREEVEKKKKEEDAKLQREMAKKLKEDQAKLKTIEKILKIPGAKLPPHLQKLYDEYYEKGKLPKGIPILPSKLKPAEPAKPAIVEKKEEPKAVEVKKEEKKEEKTEEKKQEDEDDEDDWESKFSDGEESSKIESDTKTGETEEQRVEEEQREMRSPICCVLGHVDTGKTLLLDKIRKSNVQRGEAGGITQQIGATYFPLDTIKNLTSQLNDALNLKFLVPGLLIIDTPGHESFTNLRNRGSSLCDIAILVVDVTAGIEQQTEESLKLLKKRKTPFIVALNKIDRIFEWDSTPGSPIQTSLAKQKEHVKHQFDDYVKKTQVLFSERGFNSVLYYKNKDFRKYVSIVPTSAVTGEGIPDLLMLLIQLTQRMMTDKLYISDELKCTVLEIKNIEGLGTTADVIVSDGRLREGDKIILCGMNGPIITTIRSLLTPPPLREIRVKAGKGNPYMHFKEIKAAMGVKIVAHDLGDVVAGSQLFVLKPDDDIEKLKEDVQVDLKSMIKSVSTVSRGVYVQASTLGSLEALLSFLKDSKIPVATVGIGTVHKRDVTRASIMLEHDVKYGVILAFDVKIEREAARLAENLGVRIYSAPIIYHLKDMYEAFINEIEEEERKKHAAEAVWPCVLQVFFSFFFFHP